MNMAHSTFTRTRTGWGVILAVASVTALVLVPAGVASARVAKPKITTFTASPKSVTTADGTVVLSGTVVNAASCTLSSSLPLGELPVTTSCSSGSVSYTLGVPINPGKKALKYGLVLTASGPGGSKTKKLTLSVAPGAGQPLPTGFTGIYVGSDDTGEDTGGSFTITGTADPTYGCNQSSCAYDWTAVTGGWSYPDPNGCSQWTADDNSDIGDGGIAGGGLIQSDASSPTGYSAAFSFGVWAFVCGSPPVSNEFVSHVIGGADSGDPSFTPGATQSVWPSLGGGTFTFTWNYRGIRERHVMGGLQTPNGHRGMPVPRLGHAPHNAVRQRMPGPERFACRSVLGSLTSPDNYAEYVRLRPGERQVSTAHSAFCLEGRGSTIELQPQVVECSPAIHRGNATG